MILNMPSFLKRRGYIVDPDPTDPVVIKAYENRAIISFARHSRLGPQTNIQWNR